MKTTEIIVESKTVQLGGTMYLTPFKSSHNWVEDSRGTNVCEALNERVAKILVGILNKEFMSK